MKIFVLYDPSDRAYPMLGLYTTLEKAFVAALEDGEPAPGLCVYEEETDQVYDDPKNPPFEPVFHEIRLTMKIYSSRSSMKFDLP